MLDRRMEGFVQNFLPKTLADMPDDEFSMLTEELAVAKLEAPTSLSEVASR